MNTNSVQHPKNSFVISYFILRQAIGVVGLALPVISVGGTWLLSHCFCIEPSISHYYYSIMHIVFVGLLCILGAFLVSYRGADSFENKISNLSGIFAFCVAIFPTDSKSFKGECRFLEISIHMPVLIGKIHLLCAALLFFCFVIFCFVIFPKPDDNAPIDNKKIFRNKIYKSCGWGIIISISSIISIGILDKITNVDYACKYDTTLIFETTSLWFFGFSWLIKGSLLWKTSSKPILKYLSKAIRWFLSQHIIEYAIHSRQLLAISVFNRLFTITKGVLNMALHCLMRFLAAASR